MRKILSMVLITALIISNFTIIPVHATGVTANEGWNNYTLVSGVLTNLDGGYSFKWNASTGALTGNTMITVDKVVIPSAVEGVAVKSLGGYLLSGGASTANTSVKTLIISDGITIISNGSFRNATGLASVSLPDSVVTLDTNGFAGCSSLTSISLPANLVTINSQVFYPCASLAQVTFRGNKVETIGSSAFRGIPITSIQLPSSLKSFGGSLVFSSTKLTEIEIPEGVTSIPVQMLDYCRNLKKVTFKGSIQTIGANAFRNCTALQSVVFEGRNAPTSIDSTAFTSVTQKFIVSYPQTGVGYNETFKNLFNGTTAEFATVMAAPVASGILLTGKGVVGESLNGSYTDYYDSNDDPESGSTCTWKRADDPDFVQNIVEIKTEPLSVNQISHYTLTDADNGKYISFAVTPRNGSTEYSTGDTITKIFSFQIHMPQTIPTVALIEPRASENYYSCNNISFTATATCDNATITKIEYYANDTLIGQTSEDPYRFEWQSPQIGIYRVFARAYNSLGEHADTALATISVSYDDPIKMDCIFANDMVLQRNKPIRIYGSAADNEKAVTVKLNGQEATAPIENGSFMAVLPQMLAGGPYTLEVTAARSKYTKTFTNVMIGEVWICSGQSNMVVGMNGAPQADVDAANYPNMRLFTVTKQSSAYVKDDIIGSWAVCTPTSVKYFSAVAFYFGEKIYQELNVPVALILSAVSDTRMYQWTPAEALINNGELVSYSNGVTRGDLYNGMIGPLVPFTIGGVIWYQGESDNYSTVPFEKAEMNLIQSWRDKWNLGDFPFMIVQLPNFIFTDGRPMERTREAQLDLSYKMKNVGTAITIDVGDNYNIHPKNKKPVGQRLALQALHILQPDRSFLYSSPLYKNMQITGNKIIITFDFAGDGLKTTDGADPLSFTLCGADQSFVAANAKITSPNTIEVWADSVPNPVAVRYAWYCAPPVNLVNSGDLPASPFRTDKWPLISTNNSPYVYLSSPTKDDKFHAGHSVTLKATAFDFDGTVQTVDFYANKVKIGSATTAPYTFTWTNVPAGDYSFYAVATDDAGKVSNISGSYKATIQPYITKVGITETKKNYVFNKDFENYAETSGTIPPSGLSLSLNNGKVYSAISPQNSSQSSMKLMTTAANQSPTVSDATVFDKGIISLHTKMLFDNTNAARSINICKNGTTNLIKLMEFGSDGYITSAAPYSKTFGEYAINRWYDVTVTINLYTSRMTIQINEDVLINDEVIPNIDQINGISLTQSSTVDDIVSTYFEDINYCSYNTILADNLICTLKPFTNTNGKEVYLLEGQSIVNANVQLTNPTGSDEHALFFIAAYKDNTLLTIKSVAPSDGILAAGETEYLTVQLDISPLTDVTAVKAFVFKDTANITPILPQCGLLD